MRIHAIACIATAVSLTVVSGCNSRTEERVRGQDQDASPRQLSTYHVQGTCVIKPSRVVRLKSQIGGEVKEVKVEQGAHVRKGDVLASINIADLNLKKARAQIELRRLAGKAELLRFQITRAEKEFSVVQDLAGVKSPFLPKYGKEMASLAERRSDLRDNELSQSLSQLDLKTLDEQLRKSFVLSPFDGIVLSRTVEAGMVIGSGSEGMGGGDVLFEIADPSRLIASCAVKESDALLLSIGSPVSLQVNGILNNAVDAKITSISPVIAADGGISRREFQVGLKGAMKGGLLPGMNAEVVIDTPTAFTLK